MSNTHIFWNSALNMPTDFELKIFHSLTHWQLCMKEGQQDMQVIPQDVA